MTVGDTMIELSGGVGLPLPLCKPYLVSWIFHVYSPQGLGARCWGSKRVRFTDKSSWKGRNILWHGKRCRFSFLTWNCWNFGWNLRKTVFVRKWCDFLSTVNEGTHWKVWVLKLEILDYIKENPPSFRVQKNALVSCHVLRMFSCFILLVRIWWWLYPPKNFH